tara:strand:+ start:17048 stop:17683 length:636 start_codon:yes stop_codon:yes gene_type:complete
MLNFFKKTEMPDSKSALSGREEEMPIINQHYVTGHPLKAPFPFEHHLAMFGMGCFWGAERFFWELEGVMSTAVGYSAGFTPNPKYEEVCSGLTGHNEVVLVIFDPIKISYKNLLKIFWENHDPTQGMRQGNDIGTQYRSGIYTYDETQEKIAIKTKDLYSNKLKELDFSKITTEIKKVGKFYYAEDFHQQYLAKNIGGYCGIGGIGISLPE